MARDTGQIIRRRPSTWLVRIHLCRDPKMCEDLGTRVRYWHYNVFTPQQRRERDLPALDDWLDFGKGIFR